MPKQMIARLTHITNLPSNPGTIRTETEFHEFTVQQPPAGKKTVKLICPTCAKVIEVELAGEEVVRRRRMKHAALVVGCAVFSIAVFSNVSPGEITPLEGLLVIAALVAGIAALVNAWVVLSSNARLAVTKLSLAGNHAVQGSPTEPTP